MKFEDYQGPLLVYLLSPRSVQVGVGISRREGDVGWGVAVEEGVELEVVGLEVRLEVVKLEFLPS